MLFQDADAGTEGLLSRRKCSKPNLPTCIQSFPQSPTTHSRYGRFPVKSKAIKGYGIKWRACDICSVHPLLRRAHGTDGLLKFNKVDCMI